MDDLVQFLRDRLAEDEQAARAVGASRVEATTGPWESKYLALLGVDIEVTTKLDVDPANHTACHGPARARAEVDANWAAIEHYEKLRRFAEKERREEYILAEDAAAVVIKVLALPYADHPDYREDWRP